MTGSGGASGGVDAGAPMGAPVPAPRPAPDGGVLTGTGGSAGSVGSDGGGMAGAGGFGGASDGGVAGAGGMGGISVDGGFGGRGGFGGDGGMGGFAGGGGDIGNCQDTPIGFWTFNDCNPLRTQLQDVSFQGNTAFRTVDLACGTGIDGQGVSFVDKENLVYVPDQPSFGLEKGVTVAAWVNPEKLGGARTLFRKRDGVTSAFALLLNGQKLQFIVQLASGKLVSVSSPGKVPTGAWSHVAATYDGTFLRLYINGADVSNSRVTGTMAAGAGPLLMGNDILGRRFQGTMDSAWFNTLAATPAKIAELTCIPRAPAISVDPTVGPPVGPTTPVVYQVKVTNQDSSSCPANSFNTFVSAPFDFRVNPSFAFTPPIPPGASETLPISVSGSDETEPGTHILTFFVSGRTGMPATAEARHVIVEPTGCFVRTSRELTIRDVSVVDDPARTSLDGPADDPRTGAWTFGRLMERLSPTPADAPDLTEQMFRTFVTDTTINGFTAGPRLGMEPAVLAPWPRSANGKLDLARAPMRLLAIVNRLDLKNLANGSAGEGRLVYGVLGPDGFPMEFTVIFEYQLPASTQADVDEWAATWHHLGTLPFPSEEYNTALQAVTDRFSARDAMPGRPNGSGLLDIRTNEIALSFPWELREFRLSPTTGFLAPHGLALTPDGSFNFGDTLGRFINENEASILTETHVVPASFEGAPFLGGAIFNNIDIWFAPGINNPEARHKFSLNTCNGCHGGETQTSFLHIFPRGVGEQSQLSSFLTGAGGPVFDQFTGEPRQFSELSRRRQLLESMVCP